MMLDLVQQSAFAAIGAFVGVIIGLRLRKRSGKVEPLIGGSVVLTAAAAAIVALMVMMAVNYFTGGVA